MILQSVKDILDKLVQRSLIEIFVAFAKASFDFRPIYRGDSADRWQGLTCPPEVPSP
jgi:hypothetical protein